MLEEIPQLEKQKKDIIRKSNWLYSKPKTVRKEV